MERRFKIPQETIDHLIDLAFEEDIGTGDITTQTLIPPMLKTSAFFLAKSEGVLAGIEIARRVFLKLDPEIKFKILIKDGSTIKTGDIIAEVRGKARAILTGERTALNFLQRLSGIATLTSQFVAKVRDLPVMIIDTRKTIPGFRLLEKYAVKMGGGHNHRLNLTDGILIKDNHLALLRTSGKDLKDVVTQAKKKAPHDLKVEVETTNLDEVREAVSARANIIMFDNMSPAMMKRAVKLLTPGILSEASGGVNLESVRAIAETGVNFISVGVLTHSSKALDISLELQPLSPRAK
ncbi:MAG: nicotinate-nucleotide diphosphorylase (carboxylating) [Chloroflexi bacterium RBG_13_46_9]|jgi:nicotinate-nucleotide pyrophosphorylase (carboxylating)|nr:MAG: nicotinate-nucleotide diphosphorylase (carboxylating) [Chloroflexi bacterium RBG_13_46_9]